MYTRIMFARPFKFLKRADFLKIFISQVLILKSLSWKEKTCTYMQKIMETQFYINATNNIIAKLESLIIL